jgi:hypothetical protein
MVAEPNELYDRPPAIVRATEAEEELRERAELLNRIEFADRAIEDHKMQKDYLNSRIEAIDERLKQFAIYSNMKTLKLMRGTVRVSERMKYTYPEGKEAVEKFLAEYPDFVREKVIREIDKEKVKEHIEKTGHIPMDCDANSETNVSVTMNEAIGRKF